METKLQRPAAISLVALLASLVACSSPSGSSAEAKVCGGCAEGQTCDEVTNSCVCEPESDADLKVANCATDSCGSKSATDRCGTTRVIACGDCTGPNTCGGLGIPNVCGCKAVVESDATFCARVQKNCGRVTGTDTCGKARPAATCGTCRGTDTCGGGGRANVCGCMPETEAELCSAAGVCSGVTVTDKCGATRGINCSTCDAGDACNSLAMCSVAAPDSTANGRTAALSGPGLSDCGPGANESCASAILVPAGSYMVQHLPSYQPTIGGVRLDKYEVTVGRFRKFVEAWVAGWRPAAGEGKHTALNAGLGLADAITPGVYESGWKAEWTNYVGASSSYASTPAGPGATTLAAWSTAFGNVLGGSPTWSANAGANERLPIAGVSWYDMLAFCIWDGGFLPTKNEYRVAAEGGMQDRRYPWGSADPLTRADLVVAFGPTAAAPVGSKPLGAGRWGHLDLNGNVGEFLLDFGNLTEVSVCTNCAALTQSNDAVSGQRDKVPGNWGTTATYATLATSDAVASTYPADRWNTVGGRCARTP